MKVTTFILISMNPHLIVGTAETIFGHPYWTNFGQSNFGQSIFCQFVLCCVCCVLWVLSLLHELLQKNRGLFEEWRRDCVYDPTSLRRRNIVSGGWRMKNFTNANACARPTWFASIDALTAGVNHRSMRCSLRQQLCHPANAIFPPILFHKAFRKCIAAKECQP